jgi:hypothetical protein
MKRGFPTFFQHQARSAGIPYQSCGPSRTVDSQDSAKRFEDTQLRQVAVLTLILRNLSRPRKRARMAQLSRGARLSHYRIVPSSARVAHRVETYSQEVSDSSDSIFQGERSL